MIYENVWNHTENYGDELMNYGLITSDATAGEVPGNVTPCTDFESRIYMLKGKKVQEVRQKMTKTKSGLPEQAIFHRKTGCRTACS